VLTYCWAHARPKLVEISRNGSAPIAKEEVKRMGELYRSEAELRGLAPEALFAGRQKRSGPLVADKQAWLAHHRARVATGKL
jgi:transposase